MPSDPLLVTADLVLEKGDVLSRPIVVRASRVTLDGRGATIAGPGRAGDRESFQGAGISAEGCSHVTLRNLKVRGFRVGLMVTAGADWLVEDCDFSDNYTDPEAGWDVLGRFGGIVLTRLSHSVIRRNAAQRVWNGLDLLHCDENLIEENAFSHCSNVCLKLWASCRNRVRKNDLSYGLRISPGEVHARDSAGVLIESGSDDNEFAGNDVTHGGDGIFIRVLNGWVSRRNVFVENDCSYANNNGFEAWSPDNTYVRNRANHCSYGFWLAGSDHTALVENEAAYNGCPDGFHNAPERSFGHGGIVFVGAPASHTIVRGNHCHHNQGAGIVLRGDVSTQGRRSRPYHWLIEDNCLEFNRWGIHAQYADLVHLCASRCRSNEEPDFMRGVTRLREVPRQPQLGLPPQAHVDAPPRAVVGERVAFDASGSSDPAGQPLRFLWDIGGCEYAGPTVEHVFQEPGFYRIALTVLNGARADLAWRELYIVGHREERATEGSAAAWTFRMGRDPEGKGRVTFADSPEALVGRTALEARVDPYPGGPVELLCDCWGDGRLWDFSGKKRVTVWLKRRNEYYRSFDGPNPVLRLRGPNGELRYAPACDANLLDAAENPSEARWGWLLLAIPLAGSDVWVRQATGEVSLAAIEELGLQFQSSGDEPFTIWLDGLAFE